jgi:hypothetical protein
VLPEGRQAMGAFTPSPEYAKRQEDPADDLANPTHDLKLLPAEAIVRVVAGTVAMKLSRPPRSNLTDLLGQAPGHGELATTETVVLDRASRG